MFSAGSLSSSTCLLTAAIHEVRVVYCLLCAHSSGRVEDEETIQQVQTFVAQDLDTVCTDELFILFSLPFGETRLEIGEGCHTWPVCLGRCSEHAENLEDLVNLRVAREERLASSHLCEDASDRPHVDTRTVLASTEQDLGRPVPESDNFVSIGTERDTECAGETKITNLEVAVAVDEEVLWLEIAVEDSVRVAVFDTLEELECELLDLYFVSMRRVPHQPNMRTIASPSP